MPTKKPKESVLPRRKDGAVSASEIKRPSMSDSKACWGKEKSQKRVQKSLTWWTNSLNERKKKGTGSAPSFLLFAKQIEWAALEEGGKIPPPCKSFSLPGGFITRNGGKKGKKNKNHPIIKEESLPGQETEAAQLIEAARGGKGNHIQSQNISRFRGAEVYPGRFHKTRKKKEFPA